MSTSFVSDYMKVGLLADRPTNPVSDPGTSEEMIAFYFARDVPALYFFNPITELWVEIQLV